MHWFQIAGLVLGQNVNPSLSKMVRMIVRPVSMILSVRGKGRAPLAPSKRSHTPIVHIGTVAVRSIGARVITTNHSDFRMIQRELAFHLLCWK